MRHSVALPDRESALFPKRLGLVVSVGILITAWTAPQAVATFPGDNGAIAYARHHRIWVKNTDGSEVRLGRGDEPAWSPDGDRIAFLRYGRRRGNANIWTMDADGANKVRVTSGRAFEVEPAWSPDGSTLVFVALYASSYDLYSIPSSPPFGEPVRITDTPDQDEENPRWSPDGTRIAFQALSCTDTFVCGTQIGVVDANGSHYRMLTPQVGDTEYAPDWSPDSGTLLFASNRDDTLGFHDTDIYAIPAAGGTVVRVTDSARDAKKTSPVWSPDGAMFLCVAETAAGTVSLQTIAFDAGSVVDLGRTGDFLDRADWQALP
jgi:Tol biopolymer transport system component